MQACYKSSTVQRAVVANTLPAQGSQVPVQGTSSGQAPDPAVQAGISTTATPVSAPAQQEIGREVRMLSTNPSVVSVYKMAAVGDDFNNQPSYTERRAAAAAADQKWPASTNDRKRVSEYFRFMNIVEKQAKEQGITPLAVVQAMDIERTAAHCQVSKYVKA